MRKVPTVKGVGFLAARLPAIAIGAMIGIKRPNQHDQAAGDVPVRAIGPASRIVIGLLKP